MTKKTNGMNSGSRVSEALPTPGQEELLPYTEQPGSRNREDKVKAG